MILFTADWHIKLGVKNIPKQWAVNRYVLFLDQVSEIGNKLHIVGGDIFDRTPTLEELEIYFEFVRRCKSKTLIYPGNHEATKKNNSFFPQLANVTSALNPLVEVITSTVEFDSFTILPYDDLHKPNSIEACNKSKVLFTHVRGEIPPHVKPEVDLERFADFPLVYSGDLHSHSNSQGNIVYPGSPMTTSFHRNLVESGYLLINEDDLTQWTWGKFELPQLIRKTVSSPADMLPTDFHHTIYELEGDAIDLAQVRDSELLDKKLVKKASETSLILTKDMSMMDELVEYLKYIMEIPEDKIPLLIGLFNDYVKKSNVE